MRSSACVCRCLLSLLCLLFLAAPVLAQQGGISGVVKDPQQAVIPGAQVALISTRTARRLTTTTDGLGRYSFTSLPFDTYDVEVRTQGFQLMMATVTLSAAGTVARDFALAIAGEAESLTVTARTLSLIHI